MKRGPIIVLIFIVVVVVIVGASQFLRAQPPLEISLAVTPLADAWVRNAVDGFNNSGTLVNGTRRVHVTVNTIDDLNVWSDSGQGKWRDTPPTAWIPAAKSSLDNANRLSFDVVQPSLAQTVLMWGGFSDRVNSLTDRGAHPLDWDDIAKAAAAQDWSKIADADPTWGSIKLALSRPNSSMSGLAALLSGAAAFNQQPNVNGVTISSDFQNWAEPILQSVPNYNTLGTSVAKTMAARGASVGEIALLPESEWLNNLSGQLISSTNPIQFSYPAYQFVFDFPLARTQGLSGDENAAVDALGTWLLAQHPEAYGLRPASGTLAQSSTPSALPRLFAAAETFGGELSPDVSQAVEPPSAQETQRLLLWINGATQ